MLRRVRRLQQDAGAILRAKARQDGVDHLPDGRAGPHQDQVRIPQIQPLEKAGRIAAAMDMKAQPGKQVHGAIAAIVVRFPQCQRKRSILGCVTRFHDIPQGCEEGSMRSENYHCDSRYILIERQFGPIPPS